MNKYPLVIINNEKVSNDSSNFYCENYDIKTLTEGLNEYHPVTFVARNSSKKGSQKINLRDIKLANNFINFIFIIFETFKKKNSRYLIISITPYTFFSYILLFFFKKKIFVYLRSNGYEEYKEILSHIGPLIYHLMFKIVTFKSKIISCQERLFTKRKSDIVFPSELNSLWLKNIQNPLLDKPKLLYVGRLKIEKGIFSLLKILNETSQDVELSIVGKKEKENIYTKNINFIGYGYDAPNLIKIYDEHNIFILPSFTEAHPKVVDEALARQRPVIIFNEIKHIIQNREGIFVSKRNEKSLVETIDFIIKNYSQIQERMKKNKLPTKEEFFLQMSNILSLN